MRNFFVALGLSTALATGLGGCAGIGAAPGHATIDAYASGKEHFSAGRLGLALTDFQRALEEQGPSVDRLNALAATYDRLSRFDLADSAYRQALALDPNAPQTLNNIGYSYMLRGRADLAAAYLARAQSVAKGDSVIGANLALASETLKAPAPEPLVAEPVAAPRQPTPAPTPVEMPNTPVMATPAPSRPAVALLRPEHGTHIQQIGKGVFQLVTIGEDEPEFAPATEHPHLQAELAASFEIPEVVEAMPAVTAAPVSGVQSEPLQQLQAAVATASPAELTVSMLPMAGIIKASADASEVPFATDARDTQGSIESGRALLASALIEVSNGSGIERSAARFRTYLRGEGVPVKRLTNDARFGHDHTVLYYRDGFFEAAQAIASELPMPIALERNDEQRSDLRLRLGLDSKPFDNYLAAGILTASR